MRIKTRIKGEIAILDLEGNIDINASDFIEAIGWILSQGTKNILCNFQGINLIDYIGVSVLAIIYKNVINHKGQIKLYNVPSHVRKLFSIVGLDKVLDYYDLEEQALTSFKEDEIIAGIMEKKLRRRFDRIPFKSTIEYKQKMVAGDVFYRGKVINLSAVGAFIVGEKIFSIGELLCVKLHLKPKPKIIEVDAKVVWVSSHDDNPLEYPAMGIAFHHITTKKQQEIIDFINKNAV
jgi:stage II sporulation protein AA (anti-sigma F factor antagonist)